MAKGTFLAERLLYILGGFIASLVIVSMLLLPSGNFTSLDVWRFFISPGIVALIAATIGAREGAKMSVRASQSDLAQTYLSLLDLVREDIRVNLRLMVAVQKKLLTIREQQREPVLYELEPESVHTMFIEDIEYPKLRKLVSEESIPDIINVRNVKYVFDRWNHLVDKYYQVDKPLIHDEGEDEIADRLTSLSPHRNFITSCETTLRAIENIKNDIAARATRRV